MSFSNHLVKVAVGLLTILEGLVIVLSLGFVSPHWSVEFILWDLERASRKGKKS